MLLLSGCPLTIRGHDRVFVKRVLTKGGLVLDFAFPTLLHVCLLIFFVAILYSSVGHGGASGYLAVLSFFAVSPEKMSTTALMLNVLVAGLATWSYYRAKHLSMKLAWPFILASIPAAFVGGTIRISEKTYFLLLALVLVFAAFRLAFSSRAGGDQAAEKSVNPRISLPVGAGIGVLSGIVGVGGGIFLSPIMLLMKWASVKQTAAVSALFIVVNSLAGLGGRVLRGSFDMSTSIPIVVAAFAGGLIGSYFGASKFSGFVLRRILGIVLVIAAFKLIVTMV